MWTTDVCDVYIPTHCVDMRVKATRIIIFIVDRVLNKLLEKYSSPRGVFFIIYMNGNLCISCIINFIHIYILTIVLHSLPGVTAL